MERKWEVLPDARDRQIADMKAELERLREALQQINDRPWVENALDPQWAAKVAATALSEKEPKP